jgi:Tol biopolymer transport system component
MDQKNRTPKSRIATITIIVLTVGLGCLCLPTAATPTTTPPLGPSPTPLPVSVTPVPINDGGSLNATGPWLLIETAQGLWAMNPDGSGLTQLTTVDYWSGNLQAAVEPGGNQVAFVSPGNYDFHHMALNVLSLPDGTMTKITDLTSAQTETYADSAPGDPGFEALRAVGERTSFAWSPDGLKLAFAGVMDGPSAEIYIFDERLLKVQRVSQDDAQDFAPSWSPDGQHLLYLGAEGFGTGAGMAMAGVWAANGDGTGAAQLYPTTSSGEEIVGWLDNTTAVLDTWGIDCGPQKLRLYDVVSKQQVMLSQECVSAAASSDWHNEALFANSSGLYLVTADSRTPVSVSQEAVGSIDPWGSGDQVFTARFENGGIATFGSGDVDQQVSPVSVPARYLDVAEYGAIWGWTSEDESQPGAWITGPGLDIGQIYTGMARMPTWDPHNNLLFFAAASGGGYDIYRTTFDGHFQDLAMVNTINAQVTSVVWAGPQ